MVEDNAIRFWFDNAHRVLLVRVGKHFNRDIYRSLDRAIDRIVATRGPLSAILDLTAVLDFEISSADAREIAAMHPAIPRGMACVGVAPQPIIYGTARMVETLRATTTALVKVVRTLEEAVACFGVAPLAFALIDAAS